METEIILNYSSTDSPGIINSSDVFLVDNETLKWSSAEIARLIQIIIRPILIICGTIGNCFIILRYEKIYSEGCI